MFSFRSLVNVSVKIKIYVVLFNIIITHIDLWLQPIHTTDLTRGREIQKRICKPSLWSANWPDYLCFFSSSSHLSVPVRQRRFFNFTEIRVDCMMRKEDEENEEEKRSCRS